MSNNGVMYDILSASVSQYVAVWEFIWWPASVVCPFGKLKYLSNFNTSFPRIAYFSLSSVIQLSDLYLRWYCDSTSYPFIFPEIDASLDTVNVEKLGKLLVSLSRDTQFMVVSHRPEMWTLSSALIGVYGDASGASQIVACRF